ncbi:hypothetical protein GGF38_000730, partial [Coemansia sp. RSA 25]
MPVPPFMRTNAESILLGNPADIRVDIGKNRATSSHGDSRLKRWLSLKKINVAYRQSSCDNGASTPAQPSKLRRGAGAPPRNQKPSKCPSGCRDDDNNGGDKRQHGSADGASGRPSTPMPADSPVLKVAEGVVGNHGVLPQLSLLHHRFSSPDLHWSRAPPPTVDTSESDWMDTAAPVDCLNLSELGKQTDGKQEPRPLPPRRKRSLIYAMYCTAKSSDPTAPAPIQLEEAAVPQTSDMTSAHCAPRSQQHRVPSWLCSLYSLDTTENISGTFVSCKSAQSASGSPMASLANAPEATQPAAKEATASQGNKVLVEFVLMDTLSQQALALRNQRRISAAVSVTGSASVMSCASSNRSSCAEHSLVESSAYRCSSKCAPRLSTIERGQDGRLLLRPSDSQISASAAKDVAETTCDALRDPDSGNVSLKGDSPHQDALALTAKPANGTSSTAESPRSRCLRGVSVEAFPHVVLMRPSHEHGSSAVHSPSDSLLFHTSRLNANAAAASAPSSLACEQPMAALHATQSESRTASNAAVPRPPARPALERRKMTIVTPPDSPTRPASVTAEFSTDTAGTAIAGSIEAVRSPMARCAGFTNDVPGARAQGVDAHTESEGSLSNTINASKDNDDTKLQGPDNGKAQWTDPALMPPLPEQTSAVEHTMLQSHPPVARARTDDSPNSLYSRFYSRSEESIGYRQPCGINRDSRVLSIFSDLSDCDVPPLDLSHAPLSQDEQLYNSHLRMLFDGQYGDSADLGTDSHITTTGADTETRSTMPSSSSDDECEDNMALADIVTASGAIISPGPPQPLPSTIHLDIVEVAAPAAEAANSGSPQPAVLLAGGQGNSFSARTRKLTAALVRGAPLEGLRSLHRKIKPANQHASGDSASNGDDKEAAVRQLPNSGSHQRKAFRFNELVAVYET